MRSAVHGRPRVSIHLESAAVRPHVDTEPAHVSAYPPRWLGDAQSVRMASRPCHALWMRGHQLPVAVQNLAVGADQYHGVVKRASAELGIPLVNAYRHRLLEASRRRLDRLQMRGLQVDGVLEKAAMDLAGELVVVARPQPPQPFRVSRQPWLGEGDEPCPALSRFLHQLDAALDGLVTMKQHRRGTRCGRPVW